MRIEEDSYVRNGENRELKFVLYSTIGDRHDQQDSAGYEINDTESLLVVCDGMGGHKGGRLASNTAVDGIIETYRESNHNQMNVLFESEANRIDSKIHDFEEDGEKMRAGTTIICVYISKGNMRWLSVGDSRIYIHRNGELAQATVDQNYSLLLHMRLSKNIISRERFDAEMKNGEGLISFLGVGELPVIDINDPAFKLNSGDRIVLTTDGLYKMVEDKRIEGILTNFKNINDAVTALSKEAIHQAKRKGKGRDNITFAIIEIK